MASINPDIICIQETKAREEQVELDLSEFPHRYWNSAEKKGYSGTAVFTKKKPLNVLNGMGIKKFDTEGRVITVELKGFYLLTVYTPNSKNDLARLPHRYDEWDPKFLRFVKKLEKKKPVIFCGDLNVAHQEIDIARPNANKTTEKFPGNAGFTDQEREGFDNILAAGMIDTYRHFYPNKKDIYTWWSYRAGARTNNVGWRIDYFCVSQSLKKKLIKADVLMGIMGSDHCPILLELK